MDNNIFSDLESLGFKNASKLDLYKSNNENEAKKATEKDQQLNEASFLYDKTITCPVCGTELKIRAVKNSSYRILKRDSDLFNYYSKINPYFYDVWLCNHCGYAAMKVDFPKLRDFQKDLIKKNISSKWHSKTYPIIYDVNIAIERYKIALLNYTIIDSEASKKAMTCLKIAWMYRILEDTEHEKLFLSSALEGFSKAYTNEKSPIYGMDKFTLMYLIGELYRRIDEPDKALLWFSNVITTPGVDQKLKEKARDQKDIIKDERKTAENENAENDEDKDNEEPKKGGFFSKFL